MRKVALMLCLVALAATTRAEEAPVPYEKPVLYSDTLTPEFIQANREHLQAIEQAFYDCTTGRMPLRYYSDNDPYKFLTVVEYRDLTLHVIRSAKPPEYLGERLGEIRISAPASISSISPSDRGSCREYNNIQLLGKPARMDFQTTLDVLVRNDVTVTITHRLANATALPVQTMTTLELTREGQQALTQLPIPAHHRFAKVSTPYHRIPAQLHFTPALSWDLGMMMGIAATASEGSWTPPIPGFTYLSGGHRTSYNISAVSLWLVSSRDARLRFAKVGVGLAYDKGDIGASFQLTPVSIAFGPKEKWNQSKAYTWLDRTRKRVYLDIGYNVVKFPDGFSHGPFIQTSLCVAKCNP